MFNISFKIGNSNINSINYNIEREINNSTIENNIDINSATDKGIVVMNTPYGNSITTAEHTIALMMSLARNIPNANTSTHLGNRCLLGV